MTRFDYGSMLFEQCSIRQNSISPATVMACMILASGLSFIAGYTIRRLSEGSGSRFAKIYSLITEKARAQYNAFAELCDGLDGKSDAVGSPQDTAGSDSAAEAEAEVETPKATREAATDYFPPTMSRRKKSDAGMEQINIWSSYHPRSIDTAVLKWTVQAVDGAVSRVVPEDDLIGLRSPKVLRDMYETFKGEVAHIMDS
ncbi:hypothetical protein BDW22DRAFT_1160972 [Trametopsis cervina]|nr:hypothetical protein BDW22DRAFT_1160972 [Trametopsis cervina]